MLPTKSYITGLGFSVEDACKSDKSSPLRGKLTIVGFFSLKKLFFENLLIWKKRYLGKLKMLYCRFKSTYSPVPLSVPLETISCVYVFPSYFLSSSTSAICGSVPNSYYSLNRGMVGKSRVK